MCLLALVIWLPDTEADVVVDLLAIGEYQCCRSGLVMLFYHAQQVRETRMPK
jgi:hypothetical protein